MTTHTYIKIMCLWLRKIYFTLSFSPKKKGFFVFVGVVLPVVMVALWISWEFCYETDDENEEENRSDIWGSKVKVHQDI